MCCVYVCECVHAVCVHIHAISRLYILFLLFSYSPFSSPRTIDPKVGVGIFFCLLESNGDQNCNFSKSEKLEQKERRQFDDTKYW